MAKKIVALYIGIGAIVCYLIYVIYFGQVDLLKHIIPTIITTFIFLFYTASSYFYFIDSRSYLSKFFFGLSVFAQCFQLELGGFVFKNYYFPEVSVVLNIFPNSGIDIDYHLFSYEIVNGYFHDRNIFRLSINILELLLFLVIVFWKNEKKNAI